MIRLKSRGSLNGDGKQYLLCLVCTAEMEVRTNDGDGRETRAKSEAGRSEEIGGSVDT